MRIVSCRALFVVISVGALLAGCGSPESRRDKYLAKGRDYAAQKNWDKARVEFRNALQVKPNDSVVRYENGRVAENMGSVREAIQFYQGAIDTDPDNQEARQRLARLLLLGGATEQAMTVVESGLKSHPDNADLLAVRAACRSRLKDLQGALTDAQAAYQLAPDDPQVIAVMAGTLSGLGRRDEAETVLEKAIAGQPKSVELRSALALAYVEHGKSDKAEAVYKELIALEPKDPAQYLRLANIQAASARPDDAIASLRAGIAAVPDAIALKGAVVRFIAQRSGVDAAEAELRAQVAAAPKDMRLRFALSDLFLASQQQPKAEATLTDIAALKADTASTLEAKGRLAALRARAGDLTSADRLIAEVLKDSPRDNQALTLRGELALQRGDAKGAIEDWRTVLKDQPTSVPIMRSLARAHVANGETDQAEELLRRGADAAPGDIAVRTDLISLLLQAKQPDRARAVADELVKANPNNAAVLEVQFRVAAAQHDLEGMQSISAAVERIDPKSGLGDFLAGLSAEAHGNNAAALAKYGLAVDKSPGNPDPLAAYVRAAVAQKQPALAVQKLTELTKRDPKSQTAWQMLGETELALRHLPQATEAFGRAVEIAPTAFAGYRGLALAKLAGSDVDGAVAALRSASGKVAPPEVVPTEIALVYDRADRRDEAASAYEEALRLNPGAPVAANNLAMRLIEHADPTSLERADKLVAPFAASGNPDLLDTYGWVQVARRQYPSALPALEKAVAAAPANPTFRAHLGVAQAGAGQKEAARASLEAALRDGRPFQGKSDAEAALAVVTKSGS